MAAFAITVGDPAGIGPEIVIKAVARCRDRLDDGSLRLLAIGCAEALDIAADTLGEPRLPRADDLDAVSGAAVIPIEPGGEVPQIGVVSAAAGRHAYLAIEKAVELALAGKIDGIVTAPLNKEALNLAGYAYAGHTDMLAHLTGVKGSVMMLAHGGFRVTHLTTHVALADVPKLLTPERLSHTIGLTLDALRRLGIEKPRVGVAALNPHAGEGGIFGRQDIDVTTPIVARYRDQGEDVSGPLPGDTVFVKLRGGRYDAVVAMYHDQGHIPVKLLGFHTNPETGAWEALNGVNVTLGLPIIRTSVDHGTAFDIAGTGIANADSLVEAIDYAVALAGSRHGAAAAV
ncbi:4-hydroxythreonine-4-phosphate dehydrogenase PdxA [Jiella sp. M17.18]|uniref:4-hydroxythreonine-4-phosphate dehydrogenase PdxA n=1 Tax=Jiella sp. M17.18 TaxID=3234247 RepID=UPI0034DEF9F3